MNKLGAILRRKRKELGFTNVQVSKKIDCHHSLISAYETGRRRPSLRLLKRLADLYNTSYLTLLKLRDESDAEKEIEYNIQKRLSASQRKNLQHEKALRRIHALASAGSREEIRKIAARALIE